MMIKLIVCIGGIVALAAVPTSSSASEPDSPEDWLRLAVASLCGPDLRRGLEAQQDLPGAWLISETPPEPTASALRTEQRFALSAGDELRVARLQPGGRLRRFTAEIYREVDGSHVPLVQAMADPDCEILSGRRIKRDARGSIITLEQLDSDLTTVKWRETMQAPWPLGKDPGGPRVALVDSGLAYDLDIFSDRLARGPDGTPLGFDFWDKDPWPYDGDVSRNVFQPIRHGSAVASVLVREAPSAALIPLRYPRPDMSRMGALVEYAAAAGARIIAMPLGSRKKEDWLTFRSAMQANPHVLAIVSAGNDGRDLDEKPLWPAAFDLDNIVVVTSADAFGRLAPGSSWGRSTVDIMLPAENVPVVDFRGAKVRASGTSYAVPRLAALAARILAQAPELTTQDLKARMFARATTSPYEGDIVAEGWIPDPLRD
jgi:Subtilase family